jgi:hypothetical protein
MNRIIKIAVSAALALAMAAPAAAQTTGQSNGVICPPEVDPGMKAPTPEAGKTPVIPPPGSPGGDPSVQPK